MELVRRGQRRSVASLGVKKVEISAAEADRTGIGAVERKARCQWMR